MKIGIIILCRLSSSRLPGKILLDIEGIPVLQHIYNRLQHLQTPVEIVVATSKEISDDPIQAYCESNHINCFRGDLNNVAKRFLDAASHYQFDFATRINGDNIFIDLEAFEAMLTICKTQQFDFISNVKNRTFPFGMSIEILNRSFYQSIFEKLDTKYYQEHVTIYLYERPEVGQQYHFENKVCIEAKGLQFAIDEKKDYEHAQKIMHVLKERSYEYSLSDLVKIIKTI